MFGTVIRVDKIVEMRVRDGDGKLCTPLIQQVLIDVGLSACSTEIMAKCSWKDFLKWAKAGLIAKQPRKKDFPKITSAVCKLNLLIGKLEEQEND